MDFKINLKSMKNKSKNASENKLRKWSEQEEKKELPWKSNLGAHVDPNISKLAPDGSEGFK